MELVAHHNLLLSTMMFIKCRKNIYTLSLVIVTLIMVRESHELSLDFREKGGRRFCIMSPKRLKSEMAQDEVQTVQVCES